MPVDRALKPPSPATEPPPQYANRGAVCDGGVDQVQQSDLATRALRRARCWSQSLNLLTTIYMRAGIVTLTIPGLLSAKQPSALRNIRHCARHGLPRVTANCRGPLASRMKRTSAGARSPAHSVGRDAHDDRSGRWRLGAPDAPPRPGRRRPSSGWADLVWTHHRPRICHRLPVVPHLQPHCSVCTRARSDASTHRGSSA